LTVDRKIIEAPGAPAAIGPYSHGVVSGGLLFCSGQLGLDPASGELVGKGAGEQAAKALENLAAVCEAAGARLADAVRCTVYLADIAADWAEVNASYERYFEGSEPPARVAIGVAALPLGARVEVDAVVALP
jgi:2-iminobutanoate/2-iminopropanoate deaminase